jgi:hypothetical protein
MSRPKPNIIVEQIDPKTYFSLQVLEAQAVYSVLYKGEPINIRTLNRLVSSPGPKYKKCSFSNRGHAINLAKKLNTMFKTTDFTVSEMVPKKNGKT